ncbi:MAG: hypothetical protein M3270_05135 [Thermoproteota archaeon]|nr:hypothetical protein [Thermoproteota archaeon]
MTFDKLSSLAKASPLLSALVIATFLFAGSLTTVQQTAATTLTGEEQDVIDTQEAAIQNLDESDRDVNGIEFTPRWGAVTTLQPNQIKVLFADCLEDEFAVSSMFVFETSDVIASQSFQVALPNDLMTWVTVVKNTDPNDARAASIGVVCADDNGGQENDVDISINTKSTIQNIANNFITINNNVVTNIANVVNVYQKITQNAYNIAYITGNNNTVSQIVDQTATNIANTNTTNPVDIQQIIDQEAKNVGVISGSGTLNQDIDQNATNTADVTGGGSGGAAGGNTAEQAITQGGENNANVTGGSGAGGNTVDQGVAQDAGNTANVSGSGGNAAEQAIGQRGQNSATVAEDEP